VFTRLGRELQVAAREGGADPAYNAALRTAIDRAQAENMPWENIDRAIKRGAGLISGQDIEEAIYEGYAPHGVAVMVSCLTDNRNRTVSELRNAFAKHGGSLGESGSVAWAFARRGLVRVAAGMSEEAATEAAIAAGATDVRPGGEPDTWEFVCDDTQTGQVREALAARGLAVTDAARVYEARSTVPLTGAAAEAVLNFVRRIEDLDDVQEVFANFDIADAELERLAQVI
jgi:YebC/PmpR family DNA-binding regulatory protein